MSVRTRSQLRPSGKTHGVLLVDKPKGLTSHDVVGRVRRAFGTRRVGHAGTLDPMATGVLVVLLGEATKLSSVLTTEKKVYETVIKFGETTDSLDADGKVTRRVDLAPDWLEEAALASALELERTRRLQVPPQVSALKVDGERAYARARRGLVTDLPPRDVVVHKLDLLEQSTHELRLRLDVSKGYYVRCLARDLGLSLGVPAHLTELRRVQSGPFRVEECCPLPLSGDEPLLAAAAAARQSLPILDVTQEGALRLRQGKEIDSRHISAVGSGVSGPSPLLAAFADGVWLALVKPSKDGAFRVQRGVNDPDDEQSLLPEPEPES